MARREGSDHVTTPIAARCATESRLSCWRSGRGQAIGGIVTLISKPATANQDDEYTPEQRRHIDARLAKADEDIRKGRTYGPFNTADEMIASMKAELKKRAASKVKRPRSR